MMMTDGKWLMAYREGGGGQKGSWTKQLGHIGKSLKGTVALSRIFAGSTPDRPSTN
jgi:hypothetical protein